MKDQFHLATREAENCEEDIALLPLGEGIATSQVDVRQRREYVVAKLRLLWQNRLFLYKSFLFGLIAFFLISILIPSRYQSTARLMPPDQQTGAGLTMLASLAGKAGGSDALAGIAGDVLGIKTSADLFIGVMSSRTVKDDLISKFNLREVYGERRWEDARKKLGERTDLASDRKSGIITIAVTDHSPQRAAAMGDEYIKQLNWVVTQLNTSSAHRERIFLEERLRQVQKDLENSEKDFSQFASKNVALDIPAQGKAMVEATAALEGELIGAQTQLEGLKQIYTDGNVRVRSTQARVDELQRQLQKLGGRTTVGTSPQQQDADSLYPSLRKLPLLGVEYADRLRSSKIQESVFEVLTQQYEMAKVQEAKETPSVKVLDPPDIPERKSFPPRLLITLFGGGVVLLMGALWIIEAPEWQQRDPEDPTTILVRDVAGELRKRFSFVFSSSNGRSPAELIRENQPPEGNPGPPHLEESSNLGEKSC